VGTHTVELTAESFEQATASGVVLVDFWADWCGPCRAFAPIYEQVAARHADVTFAKVDTEAQETLGERFEVESIPTLMAFKDGVLVHRQSGAVPAATLDALVSRVRRIDVEAFARAEAAKAASREGHRPDGVPEAAAWDEGDQEWAHGPLDPRGQKHGPWRFWRGDGTLCNECPFVHGQPHGPFKRFHENGEVSQEGTFAEGALHGTRRWLACDADTTERMHEQGVCEAVRRTEMDYERGRVTAIRHFNAAGERCLPTTGEKYPERPASVPKEAEFVETADQWQCVKVDAERERDGLCRFFTRDGALLFEGEYEAGARHGRWLEAAQGEFLDEQVVQLAGTCEHDHAVGAWSGLDVKGQARFTRDLGVRQSEGELAASEVLANVAKSGAQWRALGKELFGQKKPGEALLACARAAATERSVKALDELLRRVPLPRTPETAQAVARNTLSGAGESYAALADTLLLGGDPRLLLRQLAVLMDQRSRPRAALDFINAAILLKPEEHRGLLFTRALVLLSLGLPEHARRDADDLTRDDPKSAGFLKEYVRLLFPTFDFWPARVSPETSYDGLPEKPAQSLEAITRVARKYALRLTQYRAAMCARFTPGAPLPWLPPELSALAQGAQLEASTLERDDEEAEEVLIDETLSLEHVELPDLLRGARADWNALCWLCWACGEKAVQVPKKVTPPKNFSVAAGMAAQRLWRARDRRVTGRTEAQHGVAGFEFEGVELDALSPSLVGVVEQQYAELQAMFFWLTDPANASPWQDNLRGS
jgi:thioredoxin